MADPEARTQVNPVDFVEATLDAQLGMLSLGQQQELGNRLAGRFGWRKAGNLAVAETAVTVLDHDDYDLTVTALSDLGVKGTRQQPIPEFEELQAAFSPALVAYLGYLDSAKPVGTPKPELTMHVPLASKGFDLKKLIANFDKKQDYSTYVWEDHWKRYDAQAHNQPRSALEPSILLNDTRDPEEMLTEPANDYGEAGLVYVSKTVAEQRKALASEKQTAADLGVELNPISISQYIVTQAKRRQAGLPLLDKPTYTRFIQYPEQTIRGISCVPNTYVDNVDQLNLYGSYVDYSWDNGGVRRVVRIA